MLIVLIFLWIFFLLFSFFFWFHRYIVDSLYLLKSKYNSILFELSRCKKIFIDQAILNVSEYKILCDKYLVIINKIDKICDETFIDFSLLSEINIKFNFLIALSIKKKISNKLNTIGDIIKKIDKSCDPFRLYNFLLSEIFLVYREILSNLYIFNERYIDILFRENIFLLIKKCKASTYNCYCMLKSFEEKKIIDEITILSSLSAQLFETISNVYILSKIYFFLNLTISQLTKEIKLGSKSYHENTLSKFMLCITRARNELNNIKKGIINSDFKNCEKFLILCQNEINYLSTSVEYNSEAIWLIQKNLKFLDYVATNLFASYDNIDKIFLFIKDKFKNSEKILLLIVESIKSINQFKFMYHASRDKIQESINKNDIQISFEQLNNMIGIINNWKTSNSICTMHIKNDLNNFVSIINRINNLKLILIQILGNNLYDDNYENLITDAAKGFLNDLKELSVMLHENYYSNYDIVYKDVERIAISVDKILSEYDAKNILKYFAKKLIFSTNRFRNEHIDIENSLIAAEAAYKKHDYQTTIDFLITTLSNIKKSAEINHINLFK